MALITTSSQQADLDVSGGVKMYQKRRFKNADRFGLKLR